MYKFTSKEETELVQIALDAEINGYKNDFINKLVLFTQNDLYRIHAVYKWLENRKHIRALYDLYLELLLVSSSILNPNQFHELERI